MRLSILFIPLLLILLSGCYAGSEFIVEAPNVQQPVSMTSAIHDSTLQIVQAGMYDELGRFAVSFSGVGLGWPLNTHPHIDISDELNRIVKQKGGNGIVNLSIRAENTPVTYVSMFLRGVSWLGLVVGSALLFDAHSRTEPAVATMAVSAAGILFLPAAGHFVVEGTVVRTHGSPPTP